MYTVTHFETTPVFVSRLRSVVKAGNTVYVLSDGTNDFLVDVQHVDDKSLIALTHLEEGQWVELFCKRTYKTPSRDATQTITVFKVRAFEEEATEAA